MSRKLWAPLGVLALVASCLGFGLVSSAANASGGYAWSWSISATACDNGSASGTVEVTVKNTGSFSFEGVQIRGPVVGTSYGARYNLGSMDPGTTKSIAIGGLAAGSVTFSLGIANLGSIVGEETKSATVTSCVLPTPEDATASVSVSKAACNAAGVATATVVHASLQGTLNETPGAHTATFTADSGHEFADGSTMKTVRYTIPAKLSGSQCGVTPPTGSSGGGNGNGNSGGHGNSGHHHGHHASHHGHSAGPATGTHSGSSGSTGSSSTASSTPGSGTSGSGAPETGISSESSVMNTVWGFGLIGVAVFGSGVLLWRRPWITK